MEISTDYMYMHDRVGKFSEGKYNPPYLVVVEHKHGRTWAHQTPNKGPHDEAGWLSAKLIQDWDNCGFKEARVQLKTDQEPLIISLQLFLQ